MTRSTPVAIWVVAVAVWLVSSGSKMALFGSTVTVLVIVPRVGGATRRNSIQRVLAAGMDPPEQVTTWPLVAHVKPLPASTS